MVRYLSFLLFIGLAWGQSLNFKNDDKTIKIETGEKLQLNGNKYTLLKTDYFNQYVLVENHNSQMQDTLRFVSVVSFKYYEKSLNLLNKDGLIVKVGDIIQSQSLYTVDYRL
mgnify:CR=1 FL=1